MATIPHITVQLVHIHGPLSGQIQEFSDNEIRIGRHPNCQVAFPKDDVTLSRQHARIIREGNRFKIMDESTNGTYVNGQRVKEAWLKDGDVITFSESGPKVSFLTQTQQGSGQPAPPAPGMAASSPTQVTPVPPPAAAGAPSAAPPQGITSPPLVPRQSMVSRDPAPASPHSQAPAEVVTSARMPLAVQYGVALKSFQVLPITIGKGAGCDFVMNHPALQDQHIQIFFQGDQYWVKDLTGMNVVTINNAPIQGQAPLMPEARLAMSAKGPTFRFLGGGRLVELEEAPLQDTGASQTPQATTDKIPAKEGAPAKKAGGVFKKFFS